MRETEDRGHRRDVHELPLDQIGERLESLTTEELAKAISQCSAKVESCANSIRGYEQRIEHEQRDMVMARKRLAIFAEKLSERTTNIIKTAEQLAARSASDPLAKLV